MVTPVIINIKAEPAIKSPLWKEVFLLYMIVIIIIPIRRSEKPSENIIFLPNKVKINLSKKKLAYSEYSNTVYDYINQAT